MDNLLLIAVVTTAAVAAGWFYWQTQKAEQRMTEVAAQLADQATLVGETVDEIFAASQHLYHEMDRWQARVDSELVQATPATFLTRHTQEADEPATDSEAPISPTCTVLPAAITAPSAGVLPAHDQAGGAEVDAPPESDYSPHLQALRMAMEGVDPVEIARYTGIGTEELRLLLRFQEAVNSPST